MTATKPKVILPYIIALLCFAVLGAAGWFGEHARDERQSRSHSLEIAELCVEKAVEFYEAEQLSYDNLVAEVAANAIKPMELKAKRLEEMQLLMLVNPWNEVPEGYAPELENITDTQAVDVRCIDDLRHMVLDCFLAGGAPYICSSYRTQQMQQELFDNKVARVLAQGYSYEDAPAVAGQSVAVPGTSEHQLGFAVDINAENDTTDKEAYKWLSENAYKYGFILRYTAEKQPITGIIPEPWHWRYVGVEHAEKIKNSGLCLEEYLETIGIEY